MKLCFYNFYSLNQQMSPQLTIKELFYGFDNMNENHIYIVVVLRKIITDLTQMRTYYSHIPNIISYVNAITSNNINMIDEETRHFEEVYLRENVIFPTHPLELIQKILSKGDNAIQRLRSLLHEIHEGNLGDIGCMQYINSWLLTVDLPTYHYVVQQIYS